MTEDFFALSKAINNAANILAIAEINLGNRGDGDWEHVRRAQHELECALKWHEESAIRKALTALKE